MEINRSSGFLTFADLRNVSPKTENTEPGDGIRFDCIWLSFF
jgi:hypothetical protein